MNLKYDVDKLKTGLLDGNLPGVSLFAKQILHLIKAKKAGDDFTVAKIVRKDSPLIRKDILKVASNQVEEILY